MDPEQLKDEIVDLVLDIRSEAYSDGVNQHGLEGLETTELRRLLNLLCDVVVKAREPKWTVPLSEADERKLVERSVERTENDVEWAIYNLFPFAQLAADDDGWLLIQPNIMYTGKHGQNFIGPMNIDGDTPSWD